MLYVVPFTLSNTIVSETSSRESRLLVLLLVIIFNEIKEKGIHKIHDEIMLASFHLGPRLGLLPTNQRGDSYFFDFLV